MHMWNIRNSAEDLGGKGREGKLNGKKSKRETNYEGFLTRGNKLRGRLVWDGATGRWALRRARDVMSTGCYMQVMNS